MTTPSLPTCPDCGISLTAEAPDGLCPACLMRQAMLPTGGGSLPGAPPTLETVAAAFPQWEVLELIGCGGMGAVFKVRQPKLNRLAALKVIPAARAERDPAFAGRFEREGQLLARLHHPNIVTVHDSGRSGDFYYLLMEYADGVNLRQAMRASRFTPQQALTVVPKICEALQYAHEEGVLHRDIKPENILLDQKGRVKLADFGIAKLMQGGGAEAETPDMPEDPGTPSLTQFGAAPGTPRYMAPEQAAHPQEVDHRADIYSLGVVFYELLTGGLPAEAFTPPSQHAAVDRRIDAIVCQALEKERDLRQRSAGEMKTQVETVAGGFSQDEISAAVAHLRRNFEYKSARQLFGLPLLHVVSGRDPVSGRIREARGILAFGDVATGFFAFGGRAHGVLAFGGMAVGVVSFGAVSVGLFSLGGLAIGLVLAAGGLAAGPFATGGMALGWNAVGGIAAGWNASGGLVFGHYGVGGKVIATHAGNLRDVLPDTLRWLIRASPWVGFSGLLWIPFMLAGVLIPAWARKQAGPSTRV